MSTYTTSKLSLTKNMLAVLDNPFNPSEVAAADIAWPDAEWPGWVLYNPRYESKRASDVTSKLPPACGLLLGRMAAMKLPEGFLTGLVPDLGCWGAGLNEMLPEGSGLGTHLDADTHGRLHLARVLSAVLYVHYQWDVSWGGELVLAEHQPVACLPGRLVIFDCRETLHRVEPVTCPKGRSRRSLSMFWYAPALGACKRVRAKFAGYPER
jgi:hypothetical protein